MRGVILAGGRARRLQPLAPEVNKHLLVIHDRPLVCYALRTLVAAGIYDVVLVTNANHITAFEQALGTGGGFGCRITYIAQDERAGTGSAVLAAEPAVKGEPFTVILGDNIFTQDVGAELRRFEGDGQHAKIFVGEAPEPNRFGVAIINGGRIADIVEKPLVARGHNVATGLWVLRREVFDRARQLRPSPRGEYEMTDVLAAYAREARLAHAFVTGRWMDVGTPEAVAEARAYFAAASPVRAAVASRV
jgi:glucose-1-phosphate thymidylyltransferase